MGGGLSAPEIYLLIDCQVYVHQPYIVETFVLVLNYYLRLVALGWEVDENFLGYC